MAYTFNGTSQYLQLANAQYAASAYPLTMFVRGKSSDLTNHQIAATYIRQSDTYNGLGMIMAGAYAGDPLNAHGVSSGSVSYADGNWHSWSGISTGTTAHTVNADDAVDTGSTSIAFEGYYAIQVGGRLIPGFSLGLTGSACSVAIWDVALTADECKSLNAGFPPRRVRPQSLKVYAPLVRDLQAWVNKNLTTSSFTATNSPTVSDHPRSYGF